MENQKLTGTLASDRNTWVMLVALLVVATLLGAGTMAIINVNGNVEPAPATPPPQAQPAK